MNSIYLFMQKEKKKKVSLYYKLGPQIKCAYFDYFGMEIFSELLLNSKISHYNPGRNH